tara:strand:- start:21491 stop:22174 length:684 start_codon:yes stop_codon:yes gene_type:complete
MIKPILIGAGIGAVSSYAMGQDPLKGAAIGGATAGFGSAMSPATTVGTTAASTMPSHLAQTGLEQAASNAALSGGGSSIFGSFNPIQDAIDIDPSTFTASEGSLGNMMGGGGQAQLQNTGGFLEIPSINEGLLNTNTMSANTQTGPLQAANNDVGLLDNLGLGALEEYMPTKRDIGNEVIGMGVNALTPEQEERLRHQQAMLMRGQTGNVLGQGGTSGIGGQYISRA